MSTRSKSGVTRFGQWVSLPFVAVTICAMANLICHPTRITFWWAGIFWIIWTILPPFYFFLEWVFFDPEKDKIERLKYSHELAGKCWIAGVTAISAIIVVMAGGADCISKQLNNISNTAQTKVCKS